MRQGGIPSTEFFKARCNRLLQQYEDCRLGFTIGITDVSAPTCADDMTLLSNSHDNLQSMMNLACYDASQERYEFSKKKSKTMLFNPGKSVVKDINCSMNDNCIEQSVREVHLGTIRTPDGKAKQTVDENLGKARRAVYALFGTGFYGLNGLHPIVSMKLWNCYILPRLTYGLEILKCSIGDYERLEIFQRQNARRLQHLPEGTPNSLTLLMVNLLPVQSIIERKMLVLFNNLACLEDSKERDILTRQLCVKDKKSNSWVVQITNLLYKYDLPSPFDILQNPVNSKEWKMIVKTKLNTIWKEQLIRDASHKISLKYINIDIMLNKKFHHIWKCTPTNLFEVNKACIKLKLSVGKYHLQSHFNKFTSTVSPVCILCNAECEDIVHFIARCQGLSHIRSRYKGMIKDVLWSVYPMLCVAVDDDDDLFTQIVLDCTHPSLDVTLSDETIHMMEQVSRNFTYALHRDRTVKMCSIKDATGPGGSEELVNTTQ